MTGARCLYIYVSEQSKFSSLSASVRRLMVTALLPSTEYILRKMGTLLFGHVSIDGGTASSPRTTMTLTLPSRSVVCGGERCIR